MVLPFLIYPLETDRDIFTHLHTNLSAPLLCTDQNSISEINFILFSLLISILLLLLISLLLLLRCARMISYLFYIDDGEVIEQVKLRGSDALFTLVVCLSHVHMRH